VFQAIQILFFVLVYAVVVYCQLSFVERALPRQLEYAIFARGWLSVLHGALGLCFFFVIGLLLIIVVYGHYMDPGIGPAWNLIPLFGALFGLLLPWLPLLWRRQNT
jgi:hypothetical protein